jgi:AraC-like DNA-binding protein
MKETFYSRKPKSAFLQRYIAYYYFHHSAEDGYISKFAYYPHIKNALTIYKNSVLVHEDAYHTKAIPDPKTYYFAYAKLTRQFAISEIIAPFDKIGVVFQPLGINHFIEGNLSDILTTTINLDFKYFEGSMTPYLDRIYALDELDEKVGCLDAYFQSIYIGFQEERLEKAIRLLTSSTEKYTVQSLAKELHVSRKTLLRMFNKHLCCSVKDYLSVIYFRRALEIYQNTTDKMLLTNLAFDTEYYDQSEFINHFKKLTGFNPKRFFKKIVQYGEEETFWSKEVNQ